MLAKFSKATNRNTSCYILRIAGVEMVISYETIVGASYRGTRIKRDNVWGPTTRRHLKETGYAGDDFVVLDEKEFNATVRDIILRSIAEEVKEKLG